MDKIKDKKLPIQKTNFDCAVGAIRISILFLMEKIYIKVA